MDARGGGAVSFEDDSRDDQEDKLRLCPTCRSQISIFATKCKFCGEAVGRPRDEARQLTVDDLGGHDGSSYIVSGDLADAMEAFRQEQIAQSDREHEQQEPKKHATWLGRNKEVDKHPAHEPPPPGADPSGITEQLMSISAFSQTRRRAHPTPDRVWTRKMAMLGGFVAAVVILYFGGGYAKAKYDEYLAKKHVVPEVHVDNYARDYLKAGDLLGALTEARRAQREADNTENRQIAHEVREAIRDTVDSLVNAQDWEKEVLNHASRLVANAQRIDPDSKLIQEVRKQVDREVFHYSLRIEEIHIEPGGKARVFLEVQEPGREREIVVKEKGQQVSGRFVIKNITRDQIRFEDTQRKGRSNRPRQLCLSLDGTLTQC